MPTIKQEGLNTLLRQGFFSKLDFTPYTLLTSDLTDREILRSLDIINKTKKQLTEFIEQYPKIKEQLDSYENLQKDLQKDLNSSHSGILAISIIWFICGNLAISILYDTINITKTMLCICLLVNFFLMISFIYIACTHNTIKANQNLEEFKRETEPKINKLKQQIDNLSAIYLLKNSKLGINIVNALLILENLEMLEPVLQKMYVIASDTHLSSGNKLLTMENLLYLSKKAELDKQLLNEQKRVNDSIQDVKDAVKEQTEFHMMLDLERRWKNN